jgi:hypothetical protein
MINQPFSGFNFRKRLINLGIYRIFCIFATSISIMTNQNNNYTPAPVDTTNVQLPEELMALAEAIAKNVHEVWAQNRMNEGWTFGPVRDDQKRQTPCLIPYEQLPEEEKAYDRNTAFGTLKFIVSQGFEIRKT